MRQCPKCNKKLTLNDFHKDKNRIGGLDGWCKWCRNIQKKNYFNYRKTNSMCHTLGCQRPPRLNRANCEYHAQKNKEYGYKKKYGITLKEKEDIIQNQKGLCAMCFLPLLETINTCLDHNHKTGKIRGVIHRQCNIILGSVGDNLKMLNLATEYLKKFT